MSNEMVKLYDAENGAEAELIREELAANDIRAFVDNMPSPLDGLTSMGQGTPIFVNARDFDRAEAILDEYLVGDEDED
ncbi:MAG: DUF2007 domain-containing protein [Phycisphaeraceae bacterium]